MSALEKLRVLEQRLKTEGESPQVLAALARAWRQLGQVARARQCAQRSLQLDEKFAPGWNTLGTVLMDQKQWKDAEHAFHRALELDLETPFAEHNLILALRQQAWRIHHAAQRADWSPYQRDAQRLLTMHRNLMKTKGTGLVAPFSVLGFQLSAEEQLAAARAQARAFLVEQNIEAIDAPPLDDHKGRRIRLAYLSADFRDNAAGHLLHQLFAAHDRERFEVFAFSYGPDDGSSFRRTIMAGVEHFVEVRELDDERLAARMRHHRVDLVVDLMGFAGNNRAAALARRPAPRQVLWLGYCMTTGAPWIDAFVGDDVCLPGSLEASFSERVIRMPDSYQVYSGQTLPPAPSRSSCGLPEKGFVYCSFNMPEKNPPALFRRWMKILQAVPDSVLWLLCGDQETLENYRGDAVACGVAPERLVPGFIVPKQGHLARLPLADLFLDSPLCNAHTTASDALWAGVPVLTRPGSLFAQRVAASVCRAAGLPDLIVQSDADYDRVAIELGQDAARVGQLKEKLRANRATAPLFDVPGFARHLEEAFTSVLEDPRLIADRHLVRD